jgi:hypothetical protein
MRSYRPPSVAGRANTNGEHARTHTHTAPNTDVYVMSSTTEAVSYE